LDDTVSPCTKPVVLSILICSIDSRAKMLADLVADLNRQIVEACLEGEVEVLVEVDGGKISIGKKRNLLVARSTGKYICFVDDDDKVSERYVSLLASACFEGKDCVGFNGRILVGTANKKVWKKWVISVRYKEWSEDKNCYYRSPNHIAPVRRDIAVQFPFLNRSNGEDADYSSKMVAAGVLKTEAFVEQCIYDYYPSGSWAHHKAPPPVASPAVAPPRVVAKVETIRVEKRHVKKPNKVR
jgi:glycosyltransferase involved in cell wall biosynthesis